MEKDFPGRPVLNRGFGGSTMRDLLAAFDRVIGVYRPAVLVVYCGENDIALGRDPIETAEDYRILFERCRRLRPDMRIAVVSMKPSPRRWAPWPQMRRANERIAAIGWGFGADFLDVVPLMLTPAGEPRGELFREDRLHLNVEGYRLWREVIGAWLSRPALPTAAP